MINTLTTTQTSPRKSVKLDNLKRYLIWSISILRWVGYYMHKNRCLFFYENPKVALRTATQNLNMMNIRQPSQIHRPDG